MNLIIPGRIEEPDSIPQKTGTIEAPTGAPLIFTTAAGSGDLWADAGWRPAT